MWRCSNNPGRAWHGHLARASQGHLGPGERTYTARMAVRRMGETPMPRSSTVPLSRFPCSLFCPGRIAPWCTPMRCVRLCSWISSGHGITGTSGYRVPRPRNSFIVTQGSARQSDLPPLTCPKRTLGLRIKCLFTPGPAVQLPGRSATVPPRRIFDVDRNPYGKSRARKVDGGCRPDAIREIPIEKSGWNGRASSRSNYLRDP